MNTLHIRRKIALTVAVAASLFGAAACGGRSSVLQESDAGGGNFAESSGGAAAHSGGKAGTGGPKSATGGRRATGGASSAGARATGGVGAFGGFSGFGGLGGFGGSAAFGGSGGFGAVVGEGGFEDGGSVLPPPPPRDAGGFTPSPIDRVDGICFLFGALEPETSSCTGDLEYFECSEELCGLGRCATTCRGYLECLSSVSDPCSDADCDASNDCETCMASTATCGLQNCLNVLSCGVSVPGGPCDTLVACCRRDGDAGRDTCNLIAGIAHVAGDAFCQQILAPQTALPFACTSPRDQ